MTAPAPEPGKVVEVSAIPDCNFCQDGTPGPYDFATVFGPWANGCEAHWKQHRAAPGLGVGMAQLWVLPDPGDHPDADRPPGTSGSWGEA